LLAERGGVAVAAEVAGKLVDHTGGNPLALVELAEALTPEQLTGVARLPGRLPITGGVERAFLDRYRRLPEAAQTWLLVAAADDAGSVVTVRQAARSLGAGEDALDVVEQSGLLVMQNGQLRLRHPLVRSAIYGAATSARRRHVHRALADVLTGDESQDRRAWHLAAAVEEPDAGVAAELDGVARRARRRGGHEAASAAWERASELTSDAGQKARFLFASAECAWLAGHSGRACMLNDAAYPLAIDPGLRADVALLRARIEWNTGSLQRGHHLVLQGAREVAPFDPVRAREMGMFAAALASFGGDSGMGVSPVALAAAPASTESARQHCCWHLLVGLNHLACGDLEKGATVLRKAFKDGTSLENADQDLLPNLGIAALHLGDDEAALQYHNLLLTGARNTGALMMVLYALTRRSLTDIAVGDWTAGGAGASEALQLAKGTGQSGLTALPLTVLTLVASLKGEDAYLKHLAAAEHIVANYQMGTVGGLVRDALQWAKAIHGGQPEPAYHHLAQLKLPVMQCLSAIDRFEAAVRTGHTGQAEDWVQDLEKFAAATGNAWAHAAALHGRALLADGAEAESLYLAALDWHTGSLRVFNRARTQLAYGEFLRRARRRVDARTHLQAALDTFTDLGARAWEERAGQELRASGQTARKRDPSTIATLTPQELQVAGLIKQGMSNREAAAQLFLSPRTIDFHLRNVFAKLGISTRTELMRQRL
jgi:DNA-binding CsgD family transcriptional regulator